MARKDTLDTGELTDTAYYMLLTLIKHNHGYQMMQDVSILTEGNFTIGPASLYTTLKKLQVAGLIEMMASDSDHKKNYCITERGRTMLDTEYQRKKNMVQHYENILGLERTVL